jgi:hypothetical protein
MRRTPNANATSGWLRIVRSDAAPKHAEGYRLEITARGVTLEHHDEGGRLAGLTTLRQLLREYGRRLPQLVIRDYPDFPRRGVMLDISRGRVPKLETLLELVEHLADFKINEFQLYTEHTFAYRKYKAVWKDWGALTGPEIAKLDARCRALGIDLVPNQNSFGHLRSFLEYPPLKKLAEVAAPYDPEGHKSEGRAPASPQLLLKKLAHVEDARTTFLRYPSTLAPNHPGTLPFLRGLYDELLPNFTSRRFNVGCDETWDLGRGQSKTLCVRRGKGRVYLDFLKAIHREAATRGRQMMFWGDIILHYPELIAELPKDVIALNWGYEAGHPFEREARLFGKSGIAFYVCPGTSTWMTMIGRHDNALANLREAAEAGLKHGASGYLITDWGDGGHPQPLAVSYLPYLAGASLAWCAKSFDEKLLVPVLSRDVFHDPTQRLAKAAFELGLVHRKLNFHVPNSTPLGTVIAAPPPEQRELFCRDGLKHYRQIAPKNIRVTWGEIGRLRTLLAKAKPESPSGKLLASELDLAARMAAQSCSFMFWQQTVASGDFESAKIVTSVALQELRDIEKQFLRYWPKRNKGTIRKCAAFLKWRMKDLQATA